MIVANLQVPDSTARGEQLGSNLVMEMEWREHEEGARRRGV